MVGGECLEMRPNCGQGPGHEELCASAKEF